jgi:tRNA dimethylallyltransferase
VLVVIVGATGSGKTELSLDLAEALAVRGRPAEIVSADAMQLYRGMDIGTAKVPEGERRGIPHHLLDVLDVTDEASVAAYQAQAREAIGRILARGNVPILVGGSGLYVSSVVYDFRFPRTDPAVRSRLESELREAGPRALYERLSVRDPRAATAIGAHNGRRLVRALEVAELTEGPLSATLPDGAHTWPDTVIIGLHVPRGELVQRLDRRVAALWQAGLVDEVRGLLPLGLDRGPTASRAIGYAQAIAQLRGQLTAEQAIERTAALTRRYARRQVGWFKRYPHAVWLGEEARLDRAVQLVLSDG